MTKKTVLVLAILAIGRLANAQTIHSHNDYNQKVPFWEAYAHGAKSIEADLFLRNGKEIVVCHDRGAVAKAPLFEELYLRQLNRVESPSLAITLMLDFKCPSDSLSRPLLELLKRYKNTLTSKNVTITISGARPPKSSWKSYPEYVLFDGRPSETYTPEELKKVSMVSDDLQSYTAWNGKGMIPTFELEKIKQAVGNARTLGKPFRFWNTGDAPNTWLILHKLGVDVMNTDHLASCAAFFGAYKSNEYTLAKQQPTYKPTYASDGKPGKPQNVIFIIGDGMSISQITATEIANRGNLTLLNIQNIGFAKTWSLNSGVTDSAGAGTALATGEKTENRLIATRPNGELLQNAAEAFSELGKKIGVLSSGDITDATPAAQYAHALDRDSSEAIATWLTKAKVDFIAGANLNPFTKRSDNRNLFDELKSLGYRTVVSQDSIPATSGARTICIDEQMGSWTTENSIGTLAQTAVKAINHLKSENGFYVMVESAKIDHGGHNNSIRNVVLETLKLDALVAEALRFADQDGNTLVVITGDHETGGLSLLGCDRKNGTVNASFASNDHSGVSIPVFAYGVGSDEFKGVYENTEIFNKIKKLLQK